LKRMFASEDPLSTRSRSGSVIPDEHPLYVRDNADRAHWD
jgi:hypothetical protein